jgi:probable phosphoglycerate mutase
MLSNVYLARHGETEWTLNGQHTGRTDIPLTARGEEDARRLGERLRGLSFALVLTSPLGRARRTCELAGFGGNAVVDPDLSEWDYGDYEGLRTAEIRHRRPDWDLFRDGCPNGDDAPRVGIRADRVIARLRAAAGDALVFSHGHFLRVLGARWVGLPPRDASLLLCSTTSVGILGYEHHSAAEPVLRLWNDTGRLGP